MAYRAATTTTVGVIVTAPEAVQRRDQVQAPQRKGLKPYQRRTQADTCRMLPVRRAPQVCRLPLPIRVRRRTRRGSSKIWWIYWQRAVNQRQDEFWPADSDAMEHTTQDPGGLEDYEPAPGGQRVEGVGGTNLPIAGYGRLRRLADE